MKLDKLTIQEDLLEHIATPVYIKNKEGVYCFCNDAYSELLGIPKNKIIGSTAYDITSQTLADLYKEADQKLFETTLALEFDGPLQTSTNLEVNATFQKSIVYSGNEQIAGCLGMVTTDTKITPFDISELKRLTQREIDVLRLLSQGKSVKAIATCLGISTHTIQDHLKAIYLKLNVHSKNEAIYKALVLLNQGRLKII